MSAFGGNGGGEVAAGSGNGVGEVRGGRRTIGIGKADGGSTTGSPKVEEGRRTIGFEEVIDREALPPKLRGFMWLGGAA